MDYIWQEVYKGMDSKSSGSDTMSVQVRPSTPDKSRVSVNDWDP
ncbi:MAG: hypothetical protein Q8942_12100 [Bacillota bacterium]|nr:hypothetical protein [Bacillota bacterium]